MSQPFVPEKQEEKITVTIKKKEAIVIQELRKCFFGKITIVKSNGMIIDVITENRQRIKEDDEVTLANE